MPASNGIGVVCPGRRIVTDPSAWTTFADTRSRGAGSGVAT
jgi:hypothetical protein